MAGTHRQLGAPGDRRRSRTRVLAVDDDPLIRALLKDLLEGADYLVTLAASAEDARRRIAKERFDLVLCDVQMPGESGLSLARHLAAEHPETATLMLTALDDAETAQSSVGFGTAGWLLKPIRPAELLAAVASAARQLDASRHYRHEHDMLERALADRTLELERAVEAQEHQARLLSLSEAETLRRLALAVVHRSRETGDHLERIGALSALIAEQLGVEEERRERIRLASSMHDIGKIAIPDSILLKPGPLSDEERCQMQRHAEIGHRVLADSESELFGLAATIAQSHHERFDGMGYPEGLAGEEIPLEARITAVADVFDALTSDRVYRPAFGLDEALDMMAAERGGHFDPQVLDPFLDSVDEVSAIKAGVGA